jgi:D-glycero-D-manno-heptose 1,7-bisphosphate phosphatase
MSKQPAIFLDRDGVIIENRDEYVRSWADVEVFPQALKALAALSAGPYRIIIVTNQSVVGRGHITDEAAEAINSRLLEIIRAAGGRVDDVYMCPHEPETDCSCRKPLPGLLQTAADEHHLDLTNSVMIGDALTDIQAGQAAGVRLSILLRTGRGRAQERLAEDADLPAFLVFDDLLEAIDALPRPAS